MRTLNLIVARSKNNVIGKAGKIPWNLKSEQLWFREITEGEVVIMGRKTYESIGHPLKNRLNIVVSNTKVYEQESNDNDLTTLLTVKSLAEAFDLCKNMDSADVYIIGGRRLYEEAIPLVERMYISEIDTEVEEDETTVCFPEFSKHDFIKLPVGDRVEDEIPYVRTVYVSRKGSPLKERPFMLMQNIE